jgi:hypothetical protein
MRNYLSSASMLLLAGLALGPVGLSQVSPAVFAAPDVSAVTPISYPVNSTATGIVSCHGQPLPSPLIVAFVFQRSMS